MSFLSFPALSVSTRASSICLLLLAIALLAECHTAQPNFTDCRITFVANPDKYSQYRYTGKLYDGFIPTDEERRTIISLQGCKDFCGAGVDYYKWQDVAKTITTWVLPIIGLLLQAPFESNQFRNTLIALVRWIGSPIASLSYILWNIKIIGKSALMVDMSTKFNVLFNEDTRPGRLRDSMFILSVMNQYTLNPRRDTRKAIALLRIVLFADEIPSVRNFDPSQLTGRPAPAPELRDKEANDINTSLLTAAPLDLQSARSALRSATPLDLQKIRRKLAKALREGRKRGIVPVFITQMWFIFSLAISINDAFGQVGQNATAHDLALGLLLAWFPVLILSSIVDRNPLLTDATRDKLNNLLFEVETNLEDYRLAPEPKPPAPAWMTAEMNAQLLDDAPADEKGAGSQVRSVQDSGSEDPESRRGVEYGFFQKFAGQGRLRWHYGVAHPIQLGIEKIILRHRRKPESPRDWLTIPDIDNELVRGSGDERGLLEFDAREVWEFLSALFVVAGTISGAFVISFRTPTVGLGCRAGGYVIFGSLALGLFAFELFFWWLIAKLHKQRNSRLPFVVNWIFIFVEFVNTTWLIYIIMAQTIGSYQTCDCQSSNWGHYGGYIDFSVSETAFGVKIYWLTGVCISSVIMFISLAFLVAEWCEQSHLNSENFNEAREGLAMTRSWKRRTLWIRRLPEFFIWIAKYIWHLVVKKRDLTPRQSLYWEVGPLEDRSYVPT
ncbi:MAG: hypothetical protein M1824_006072 [Vezdaea acicularis]|nr:MAG: hypothetical protein M1824_006072 [Vezdaea acicularis]